MAMLLKNDKGINRKNIRKDKNLTLDIESSVRQIPVPFIDDKIHEYEQYVKEKDSCNDYRLLFTVFPYCTNALFNVVTEIVEDEGGDSCNIITKGKMLVNNDKANAYNSYTDRTKIDRHICIKDTGYSHPECGGYTYHCGYDIFNNHIIRSKDFFVVNKCLSEYIDPQGVVHKVNRENFNTIFDKRRDVNGLFSSTSDTYSINKNKLTCDSNSHLYTRDSIYDFKSSIANNLKEENGWMGFYNKSNLKINNYNDISLNKVLNSNESGEFIDMYPDRSLFSFIPKENVKRGRFEYNWKVCLTYPYENYYNDLVKYGDINGPECKIVNYDENEEYSDNYEIVFKSKIKHTLKQSDFIKLYFIYGENNIKESVICRVTSSDGINFGVSYSDIDDVILEGVNIKSIRYVKYTNGVPCKYYFRKFKKVINFGDVGVANDGNITKSEIDLYKNSDFSINIEKNAFSKSVYNDNIVQVLLNNKVNPKNLRDNLGREVSEIYLTFIKTNNGYNKWYKKENPTYGDSDIEFSHCFGKLTAGLDFDDDVDDYNVHKIHNIENTYEKLVTKRVKNLEKNEYEITINGDSLFGSDNGEFFGDIVEYYPNLCSEITLEDVFFRFNTAQREYEGGEYDTLMVDDIIRDDTDFSLKTEEENFSGITYNFCNHKANLAPEGYYYKPHYKIVLKEYSDEVKQGKHQELLYKVVGCAKNLLHIKTNIDYSFFDADKIMIYDKYTNKTEVGQVLSVNEKNRTDVVLRWFCDINDEEIDKELAQFGNQDIFGEGINRSKHLTSNTKRDKVNDIERIIVSIDYNKSIKSGETLKIKTPGGKNYLTLTISILDIENNSLLDDTYFNETPCEFYIYDTSNTVGQMFIENYHSKNSLNLEYTTFANGVSSCSLTIKCGELERKINIEAIVDDVQKIEYEGIVPTSSVDRIYDDREIMFRKLIIDTKNPYEIIDKYDFSIDLSMANFLSQYNDNGQIQSGYIYIGLTNDEPSKLYIKVINKNNGVFGLKEFGTTVIEDTKYKSFGLELFNYDKEHPHIYNCEIEVTYGDIKRILPVSYEITVSDNENTDSDSGTTVNPDDSGTTVNPDDSGTTVNPDDSGTTVNPDEDYSSINWADGIENGRYRIYKYNQLKPSTAIELNNGSGIYLWRDFKTETELISGDETYAMSFLNGCKYIHKNINFYLRRQDPYGNYGLQYTPENGSYNSAISLTVKGKYDKEDYSDKSDYINEDEMTLC